MSALTAILRLNAILTRGMDTMALVMLLVQVAMTAGAVFLAFWLPRQ